MPKLNLQARSTQSHSVTEYHIYTITEDFFKLTKQELTDLVQVGEVLMFKSHLDEQGTLLKCSDIDMYQEIVVHTEVRRQNSPQNLEYTAQEALSYMTDIQIMEEDGEIPCSLQLDMEMANESENIQ
tara:strand:+ start:4872 stop:5252 length:381 start_codon:yes stop_codon:yes gene_type:complete